DPDRRGGVLAAALAACPHLAAADGGHGARPDPAGERRRRRLPVAAGHGRLRGRQAPAQRPHLSVSRGLSVSVTSSRSPNAPDGSVSGEDSKTALRALSATSRYSASRV